MFEPKATASHSNSTKLGSGGASARLLLCPDERTSPPSLAMSVWCQIRKSNAALPRRSHQHREALFSIFIRLSARHRGFERWCCSCF